jgi:chromosome condensin MukBEF MukE localization factor
LKTTGVGFILSVGHKDHGHTYECVAWYRFGSDVRALQRQVEAVRGMFDHQTLEHELCLGENLAAEIGRQLPGCIQVDVNRPLERIYARWVA